MKTLKLVDRAVRGGWGMAAVPLALALLFAAHPAHAQRMPQDSWYLAKEVPAGGGGKFNYPYDVAVGPDGNIYVADYSNNRIQVLDSEGSLIRSWNGSSAGVPNSYFYPRSLHVASDGKVYVADQNNHRVLVFDAQGKFLRAMGQQGSAEGQLNYPQAIAVDSAGNVYVGDNNYFVSVFDSSGAYVRRFGGSGSSDGKFSDIYDIQILAGNKIAVLSGGKIQFFNTDGTFSSKIEAIWNTYTFSIDSSGNYFFAGWGSKVQKRSSTGTLLQEFNLEGKIGNSVYGIALTANRIYLADYENHRLAVLDASGNFLTSWGRYGRSSDPSIFGLAADGQGNFYLCDFDRSEIRKYDSDWKLLKKFGSEGNGNGQLGGVRDLAVGANGTRLYALEQNNNRVQIFDLEGNYVNKFGGPGSGNGQFNMPSGIAVGKDGKVYVADRDNHRVQVFSSAGAHIGSFGTQGSFDGQFKSPTSVSVSRNGNIAVADSDNQRVQVFDSDGKFLSKINFATSGSGYPWGLEFFSDGVLGVYNYNWKNSASEPNNGWISFSDQVGIPLKVWDSLWASMVESMEGDMVVANGDGKIRVWKRTFRTVHPEPANALPLPTIVSQKRRPGTALVDVDYTVKDADNATVQTAALAFKNGGNSLSDVIPITSFAEGTGNKLGANIATGQTHRFTWDVARDWSTDFGEVQFEILAKDGRGLLNLDFIQIPAIGGQPSLKISRSPLTDNDFLSVWYWLIATGDTGVRFENGQVYKAESYDEGLLGEYYGGDYYWNGSPLARGGDVPFASEAFNSNLNSAQWSGFFYPEKTGQYSFRIGILDSGSIRPPLFSGDGSGDVVSMWVGGSQVVTDNAPTQFSVSAQAGVRIPIRIYWNKGYNYYYYQFRSFTFYLTPPSESERTLVKSDFQHRLPIASGTGTTDSGRAYLFQRMGLREATAAEVTRAKEAGTPGVINLWEPKLRVGPGERPAMVNAYGFDTGYTYWPGSGMPGYWVVPVSGN